MKYTSLILILVVFLCRVGLGYDVYQSDALPKITNCHTDHHDEFPTTEAEANSYKSKETAEHNTCVCEYALPNAPHGHNLNLREFISYSVSLSLPTLENKNFPSVSSNLGIKNHHPPDLFIANSSLLL